MSTSSAGLLALAEHWESQCNRYANGFCSTRRCLVRGGWEAGTPDCSMATCEEHETAAALRARASQEHQQ
jgi:hypothetical protein